MNSTPSPSPGTLGVIQKNSSHLNYQTDKLEVFRCKKGQIISSDLKIPFDFGIIFESDGIYTFEISINEDFDLGLFEKDENEKYFNDIYNAECNSDENHSLEIKNLQFSNLQSGTSKAILTCYDCIIRTKKRESPFEKAIPPNKSPKIHYIELEGLKMQFSDITEETKERRGMKLRDGNNFKRDHTAASLVYKEFMYNQIFYKSENNNNIIVEFPHTSVSNSLLFETYSEFKLNYTYVLSLLNGAEVRVRREFTGDYYSGGKVDSHVMIIYSFKTVKNERYNHYIPLNNLFTRGANIINRFFVLSFDKYNEWNNKIDLNSIIFYFINSVQSQSIEEIVFVQMIAFERLTTLYAEYCGEKEVFIPTKEDFIEIKMELLTVLEKHKEKFKDSFYIAKSKISNLNQVKRLSTTDKMYRIIQDVNIPITQEIEMLVEQARHKTIHRGELETGNKKITSFYLLDELIQEIILRLVGYEGPRETRLVTQ